MFDTSPTNTLFPIFLKLDKLNTLIVGGGKVGYEKLSAILANSPGAAITLVAEKISVPIKSFLTGRDNVIVFEKKYEEKDLAGKDLIILAANNKLLHAEIKKQANKRGLLVNVADTPELCDFYLGSIVQKGHLKLAISTNGQSPTMAKRIKEVLNEAIPAGINESIENLTLIRQRLNGNFAAKVQELNRITTLLVKEEPVKHVNKLQLKHYFSLAVLAAFIIGFILSAYLSNQPIREFLFSLNQHIHPQFYLFVLFGFVAQLIDGALGMAYGVSSATLLLSIGIPPVVTTASMHTSEILVYASSSYVYAKSKQINKKLFKSLAITGVLGAITGASLLAILGNYTTAIKPLVALYCIFLGVTILRKALNKKVVRKQKTKNVGLLGFIGGVLDTMGGGGWGPLVTSSLVAGGRSLRYTIGSAHLAKFCVAIAGSITFLLLLKQQHYWHIVFGLMIGGVVAAPISIWISSKIPVKVGLITVAIAVILLSLKTILNILI